MQGAKQTKTRTRSNSKKKETKIVYTRLLLKNNLKSIIVLESTRKRGSETHKKIERIIVKFNLDAYLRNL